MIKSKENGEKVTPKKYAADLILGILNTSFDILAQETRFRDEDMTDREWRLVQEQMWKYLEKIDDVLGVHK